jgi:outer membrane protein assembly factor BamE (lipoprotein component of BamABCDE complex)
MAPGPMRARPIVARVEEMRRDIRFMTRAVALSMLAGALSGCLGYDGEVQRGYVIDQKALDQVKPGSSAEQVLVLLGTPSTTSTVGGSAWYYISQTVDRTLAFSAPSVTDQHVLAVYFDPGKKVERVANYGIEDGKIVDFVSRATPTSGAEESFLKNIFKSFGRGLFG